MTRYVTPLSFVGRKTTPEEALATRNSLSECNVYHEGEQNLCITPFLDLKKEFGLRSRSPGIRPVEQLFRAHPKLFFRDPPRVLRGGRSKNGNPICLIRSSASWREWMLQFRDNLRDIVDPRGMVRLEHRRRPDNSTSGDDCTFTGVWGESGRAYHKLTNARRKAQEEKPGRESANFNPVVADGALKLSYEKYGRLLVFDTALTRLFDEAGNSSLKGYDIIMETSMCMIIGAWEKRMTIWLIFMLIVTAGRVSELQEMVVASGL
ncbi:hypothetical protein N7532_009988 [Penicillium argentinense]|uniref:Uncharacterized protein n=1 Tax=Penicillium argentinense TaxID=1131581 RepID=A0A9W9JY20_9EURO|nr:uncharacterized protein N7532_009988 [Penicillium argentinense]KAJ5085217.1 hypothetical protein N7532_009988 [Penicillium argentinense]